MFSEIPTIHHQVYIFSQYCFPKFFVIHTVKGFGIVNKAEIEIEFSFTWATMRVAAWEAASQIALRVLQSGSGGKSIYKVLVKGEFISMKHSFYKRFSLVVRIRCHHLGI